MRQLVVLVGCAVILSGLAGCKKANRGVEVTIAGGGEFPEFLVGRWMDDKKSWEFVFEPDGSLSSAVVVYAGVTMTPGEATRFNAIPEGIGVFEPGVWKVDYVPETRDLKVEIVIDNFYLDMAPDAWEGSSEDVFIGHVSPDKKKLKMDWYSFPKLVMHIGSTSERFELPIDPNETVPEPLIFRKAPQKSE
jgi:hypothetical protein